MDRTDWFVPLLWGAALGAGIGIVSSSVINDTCQVTDSPEPTAPVTEQFVDGERIAHISHKSGLYVVHDYENGQICYYARSYQSVALDCHVADLHVEE